MKIAVVSRSMLDGQSIASLLNDCFIRIETSMEIVNLISISLGFVHQLFKDVGVRKPIDYENNFSLLHAPLPNDGTAWQAAEMLNEVIDYVDRTFWLRNIPEDNVIVHGFRTHDQIISFAEAGYEICQVMDREHCHFPRYSSWWINTDCLPKEIWEQCANSVERFTNKTITRPEEKDETSA